MTAPRDAAVLVPVFFDPDRGPCLVLVRRGDAGIHGGQLAFPGGKVDPSDASPFDAARREAHEEIGLDPGDVTDVVPLPVVATRTTGFRIHPFLARVPAREWLAAPGEIAGVVEVPVADLAQDGARGEEVMDFPTWPAPRLTPFFRAGEHRIWGATYRILDPLLPRLLVAEAGPGLTS